MKHFLANWKMYLSAEESIGLAQEIKNWQYDMKTVNLVLFPSALCFREIERMGLTVGAQNVSWTPQGAYTGAISAYLFSEAGAKYALVGHSERRYIFGEGNPEVRKKVEACFENDIIPILCIGETKRDRDEDKTEYRLKKQIAAVYDNLEVVANKMIIAYEPVWAISRGGEGEPCSPVQAEKEMAYIRREVAQYCDHSVDILYGGSVDSENMLSYAALKSGSGVLVGSASTKADSLKQMIERLSDLRN